MDASEEVKSCVDPECGHWMVLEPKNTRLTIASAVMSSLPEGTLWVGNPDVLDALKVRSGWLLHIPHGTAQ